MAATDSVIARLSAELDDRRTFQDTLLAAADEEGRDLTAQEMELYTRANTRLGEIEAQLGPLLEGTRIATQSRSRTAEVMAAVSTSTRAASRPPVEYRTAGAYIVDMIRAGMGNVEIAQRLDVYNRAAAHQTTADNPGLIPSQILGPVIDDIDAARPLVDAIGPRQVPAGGSWSRPRITQHTQVGAQAGEKTELASRKLLIEKLPVATATYGGYVNVSRQNIDWSSPAIMDIVIADLGNQYAIETEEAAATDLAAAAVAGPVIPAVPTALDIATALWTAAGQAIAATKGGRLTLAVSPDMLGLLGPVLPPVNPTNAISTGLAAGNFGSGAFPAVSGMNSVMTWALPTGTALVFTSRAVEAYEDRIGSLQVVEPSVLGTQVAYAGYFNVLVLNANGIIEITKAP